MKFHIIRIPVPEWVRSFRKAYRSLPHEYGWIAIELRLHLEAHGYSVNAWENP